MPELPEVETIAHGLHCAVAGARISAVHVTRPDVLREVDARMLVRRVRGAGIVRVWRRAKLVVLELSTADRILVQPRFTGAMLVAAPDAPLAERDLHYSTVELVLEDARSIHYSDVRRLGTFALMDPERFARYTGALGIEPLDPGFTADHLSGLLRGSRQSVKKILMDQRGVVGVGNIYANEALWRAGIDPSRQGRLVTAAEAARLRDDVVEVLREAIHARGTSFRDYRDARGEPGSFVIRLAAYGRAGQPCLRCGARLVGTHAIDGRQTVLCAHCQS